MEYDDLDEPTDEHTLRDGASNMWRASCFFADEDTPAQNFHRSYPRWHFQPTCPLSQYALCIEAHYCRSRHCDFIFAQNAQSESISLLQDLPGPLQTLRNDLDEVIVPRALPQTSLAACAESLEPLALRRPEGVEAHLEDDLDEAVESPASETEVTLWDDLHEEEDRPPSPHQNLGLRDDLEEAFELAQEASNFPKGRDLVDDLDEPITGNASSTHAASSQLQEDIADDLGRAADYNSPDGSELDQLRDDLDELMVDELISEVSDLMLHGRRVAGGSGDHGRAGRARKTASAVAEELPLITGVTTYRDAAVTKVPRSSGEGEINGLQVLHNVSCALPVTEKSRLDMILATDRSKSTVPVSETLGVQCRKSISEIDNGDGARTSSEVMDVLDEENGSSDLPILPTDTNDTIPSAGASPVPVSESRADPSSPTYQSRSSSPDFHPISLTSSPPSPQLLPDSPNRKLRDADEPPEVARRGDPTSEVAAQSFRELDVPAPPPGFFPAPRDPQSHPGLADLTPQQEAPVTSAPTLVDPAVSRPDPGAAGDATRRGPVEPGTVLARIDALLAAVAACRQRGETPELLLPARARWQDLRLCSQAGHLVMSDAPRAESRVPSQNRLELMVLLLRKIRHLIATNTHATKRDIFYQEVSVFGSQRSVDALLDDVTALLAIPRESSHVRATSKGLVAGDLVLQSGDVLLDCSAAKHGLLVPEDVPNLKLVRSSARFILVIEKDATFQKVLDSGMLQHLPPAIVITGKGFPDINSRLLLRLLSSQLHVPALALLDADPHGLEIFFVYKYGSLAQAREAARLTTPNLIWLGVKPTEVLQLGIPHSALLPLSDADRSKAQCLLSRPYVKNNRYWQRQIREILASKRKAEIQCLAGIHPTFLTDLYLPSKIQECLSGTPGASECLPGTHGVPECLADTRGVLGSQVNTHRVSGLPGVPAECPTDWEGEPMECSASTPKQLTKCQASIPGVSECVAESAGVPEFQTRVPMESGELISGT